MPNLPESNTFDAVRQWETTDPALGGAATLFTQPAQNLTNRTKYLKTLIDNVISGATGIIGKLLDGSTVANIFTSFQQSDTAVASTAFVQGAVALKGGRRNVLINGDMSISQRGEGFTLGANEQLFTLDRWLAHGDIGTGDTFRVYRDNQILQGAMTGARYAMKLYFNAASTKMTIKQRVYNGRVFEGEKATLQFMLSLSAACSLKLKLSRYLNAAQLGASTPEWSDEITVSGTADVKRYVAVFDIPSIATPIAQDKDDDGCIEVSILFDHAAGASLTCGLTNVQLESGEIPGAFENRDDLPVCLTYFEATTIFEKYDRSITSDGGLGIPAFYTRQYWGAKRRVPTLSVASEHLTNVTSYSLDQVSKNACTLAWQPSSTTMTVTYRMVNIEILIDAEI